MDTDLPELLLPGQLMALRLRLLLYHCWFNIWRLEVSMLLTGDAGVHELTLPGVVVAVAVLPPATAACVLLVALLELPVLPPLLQRSHLSAKNVAASSS